MKFDWNKILQPKTVVHCPEEWMAMELFDEAHEKGLKWNNKDSYLGYRAWIYEKNQCYNFKRGMHSPLDYFLQGGYNILHFNDAIKNKIFIKRNKTIKY